MSSVNKMMTQQAVDKSKLLRQEEDMTEMKKQLETQHKVNTELEAKLQNLKR